jgi:hypothetical protein
MAAISSGTVAFAATASAAMAASGSSSNGTIDRPAP